MKKLSKKPQIVIYQAIGHEQKISVRIEGENVWLTQKLIAELFDVDVRTVNEHIKNIYFERELDENLTIRNFRIVQKEASREVTRNVKHYNLEAILAVAIVVFTWWPSQILSAVVSMWIVIVSAVLLLLHALFCKHCEGICAGWMKGNNKRRR